MPGHANYILARPGIHVFLCQPQGRVDGRVTWRDHALCPAMTFVIKGRLRTRAIILQQSERILGASRNAGGQ